MTKHRDDVVQPDIEDIPKKRKIRRKVNLSYRDLYCLAETGLTDKEIAHILNVSIHQLAKYRSVLKEGRARLSQSIKRTQLELALQKKDRNMLIWVGKQYAGQSEKQDIDHSGESMSQQIVFYGDKQPKKWNEDKKESF